MTEPAPKLFPCSSIARAIDRDPRSVRRTLEQEECRQGEINGVAVKLYPLEVIRRHFAVELEAAREAKRYRDDLTLLQAPAAAVWQPRIPLDEVAGEFRTKAAKLRRALLPAIARLEDTSLSGAEFERLGLNDYVATFGERVTERHWRALLKRTLERDGGREDWQRLEIYLPDNARSAATAPQPAAMPVHHSFSHLAATPVADKANPTPREIDLLWEAALNDFESARASAATPAKLKRAILEALLRCVKVAASFNSARTIFDVKYKAWIAGGKTLTTIANKKFRHNRPASAPDPELIERAARLGYLAGKNHGDAVAPAFRELVAQGLEKPTNSGNKSYVPRELLRRARPDALLVAATVKNKRALRDMVPKLSCDPDKYFVNDIFTADDFTMPVLFYVPDGKGWFNLVQGQCLIVADWRSWRVLQYSLQPDPQYNSKVIRTLFAKTFAAHHLPKQLRLEGGIWRTSSLIHGNDAERKAAEDAGLEYTDGDVVHGLKSQLGIKIVHAISPTGKTQIESIGRLVQDYMWQDKGYCGREQKNDLPDAVKRQKYEVDRRQAHPSQYFYSFAEWTERLHQIFTEYNAAKQQGVWLNNESPDEAFEKYQDRQDPPIAFDARCAHLLAYQVAERRIKSDHSIRFEIGREKFCYFDQQLMRLAPGTRVLTHFDPELSGSIVVTDLDRRNPFTVPRSLRTGNTDDPVTQAELGKKSACEGYLRTRYRTLHAKHKAIVRTPVVTRDVAELGAQMEIQRAAVATEEKRVARTRRAAAKIGVHLTSAARRNAETPEALKDLNEFLNSDEP